MEKSQQMLRLNWITTEVLITGGKHFSDASGILNALALKKK